MDKTLNNKGGLNERPKGDVFVRQLLANEKRIYAFILALVPSLSDADDIMQETAALMWEKYMKMEHASISNFAAWGTRIAHFKILEYRKKAYDKRIQFNNDVFDNLLGGAVAVSEGIDDRFEAMKKCLSKLSPYDRRLIQLRHQKEETTKSIAGRLGVSVDLIYKKVPRIHGILLRCIQKTLRMQEAL